MKRKGIYALTSLLIVGLFVVGAVSVMAEYGDSNDPLITKSYIDSVLTRDVEQMIDNAIADKKTVIDSYVSNAMTAHKAEIDKKIASINTGNINISHCFHPFWNFCLYPQEALKCAHRARWSGPPRRSIRG